MSLNVECERCDRNGGKPEPCELIPHLMAFVCARCVAELHADHVVQLERLSAPDSPWTWVKEPCPVCKGIGILPRITPSKLRPGRRYDDCNHCQNSGYVSRLLQPLQSLQPTFVEARP